MLLLEMIPAFQNQLMLFDLPQQHTWRDMCKIVAWYINQNNKRNDNFEILSDELINQL